MVALDDPQRTDDVLDERPIRVLLGPTASGKTELSLRLAERLGAELLSLDSMLVYRGMDIGTAKPTVAEQARAPHHLIDLVSPEVRYDVQAYLADARQALAEVLGRGRPAVFVGGTGFYLAALLRGLFEGPAVEPELRERLEARMLQEGPAAMHAELAEKDPASAERLHANDQRRVVRALEVLEQSGRPLSDWQREWGAGPRERERRARLVGLSLPTPELDARIRARTRTMLAAGWREEALRVRDGCGFGPTAVQALGYREVLEWDAGRLERDAAEAEIALRTRQFARRQRSWYRKFDIEWLDARESTGALLERALAVLS